jgi:hypothetical protein
MTIYYKNNENEYLKTLEKIKENLKRYVVILGKYYNGANLQDKIEIIIDNLANDFNDDRYIKITNEYFEFNFYTSYPEMEDEVQNNIIKISSDYKNITIKSGYGNFNFYDEFRIDNRHIYENENKLIDGNTKCYSSTIRK